MKLLLFYKTLPGIILFFLAGEVLRTTLDFYFNQDTARKAQTTLKLS